MQQTLTYPASPRRGALAAGLAVSILLHILLLAFWRAPTIPPQPAEARRWTQPLTVQILPPPPPKPVARAEPPKQAVKPGKPVRTPPRAVAERARPDSAPQPSMTIVTPAPTEAAPAEEAPKFDPDAARAAARAMANDLKEPSENWAAEKLNKGKEWKETKEQRLGRNVENSARPDCRTAYSGYGLLAPLKMLMDKKDSGCKF
jgi:hypothetical protein